MRAAFLLGRHDTFDDRGPCRLQQPCRIDRFAHDLTVLERACVLNDDVGIVLQHTDYHLAAEGLGAKGFLLDTADKIESVLQEAKRVAAAGQPVLINALLGSSSFREGSISM